MTISCSQLDSNSNKANMSICNTIYIYSTSLNQSHSESNNQYLQILTCQLYYNTIKLIHTIIQTFPISIKTHSITYLDQIHILYKIIKFNHFTFNFTQYTTLLKSKQSCKEILKLVTMSPHI